MQAIDPNFPGLRSINALISIVERQDMQSSISTLVELVNDNPNNLALYRDLATAFVDIRRLDLNVQITKEIAKRDPQSNLSWGLYITALLAVGDLEAARNALQNLDVLGAPARFTHIEVALSEGNFEALAKEIEQGRAAIGDNSFYIRREALMHSIRGDVSVAAELLKRLKNASSPVSSDYGGVSYSDLQEAAIIQRNTRDALRYFEEALKNKEQQAIRGTYGGFFAFRKYFPEYYNSPSYLEILRKYQIDDESLAKIKVPELSLQH